RPMITSTTRSSRRVNPLAASWPERARPAKQIREADFGLQGNIVDAGNRGEQSDHDHADHTADKKNSQRFEHSHHSFDAVSPFLLGKRGCRLQHLGEATGTFANPDQVYQRLVEQTVILKRRGKRIAVANTAFDLIESYLKTLQPQRLAGDGQAAHQ